tara:strand:- start:427 stop:747 length:321 start_codon:yes stop_codon:yes gene_type:complete
VSWGGDPIAYKERKNFFRTKIDLGITQWDNCYLGKSSDEIFHIGGNLGTGGQILGQFLNLSISGDFSSDQQPQETFRKRLLVNLSNKRFELEDRMELKLYFCNTPL